ncbi:MAG: choice-of-anchor B family protein [Rubricoccaceae bacterium]|nr:choice-of-anchor B family protein [Rubricoccaceae bacterium]
MRSLLLAFAALPLVAAPLQAQTPCAGGTAGPYPCEDIDLLARLPLSTFGTTAMNDIWGWTDPQDGREYALVGYRSGTAFVDVTTPTAPVLVGSLPTATGNSTWRDIKTYANHAFIVSESTGHGMQVFDLTRLRSVSNPPVTFSADARYTGFGNAHNIVIDDESGFAYAVGSNRCSGGLEIVDIRIPTSPSDAGCFSSDGYTHDAQCITYDGPDPDYAGREICAASNEDTVTFVDVTNKSNPTLISRAFYPSPGYTHQGWFTEDRRHFLVDDEFDEFFTSNRTRTIVLDVADLDNPGFGFFYLGPLGTSDHNLYVNGQYAFLSNYTGGLRIVDLSDIDSGTLVEVASFDTYPSSNADGFSGQWSNYPFFPSGTVVANDQSNGLFVLGPTLSSGSTVTASIAPLDPPIVIPAAGGPFSFTATLTNTGGQAQTVDAWVAAILPNGSEYDRPVVGPRTVTLSAGETFGPLTLSATVPGAAPAGEYTVELRVGDYPSSVDASDSFTLTKAAAAGAALASAEMALGIAPNPSVDQATVRFALDAPANARLAVYDVRGREVAVLLDGALAAGAHAAVVDGAALPSGTYVVVLRAGNRIERHTLTLLR